MQIKTYLFLLLGFMISCSELNPTNESAIDSSNAPSSGDAVPAEITHEIDTDIDSPIDIEETSDEIVMPTNTTGAFLAKCFWVKQENGVGFFLGCNVTDKDGNRVENKENDFVLTFENIDGSNFSPEEAKVVIPGSFDFVFRFDQIPQDKLIVSIKRKKYPKVHTASLEVGSPKTKSGISTTVATGEEVPVYSSKPISKYLADNDYALVDLVAGGEKGKIEIVSAGVLAKADGNYSIWEITNPTSDSVSFKISSADWSALLNLPGESRIYILSNSLDNHKVGFNDQSIEAIFENKEFAQEPDLLVRVDRTIEIKTSP